MCLTANNILIGPISNSHINPAVTLGVLVREFGEERSGRSQGKMGKNIAFAMLIILSQILGAGLGALLVSLIRYGEDDPETSAIGIG